MPEQPWRNPRPAPQLAEFQERFRRNGPLTWLRAWGPAIFWACIIFSLSTDTFSAQHTGSILEQIFRWIHISLTRAQFNAIHFAVRKSAHFTEYFVFCLLLYRGIRGGKNGWRWSWALAAFFVAAGYSVLDEVHQSFVASRTASPYDSLLDSAGALCAVIALFLWFRFRPLPRAKTTDARSAVLN